ncbi:MAG: hypothetical protein NT004_03250, partial [Bacteroidetes bacterium]|nr:hypothetical protein [Bacteroidota bacterium]
QKKASRYKVPQTVLGIVVLTRAYIIDQLTGEPIQESVMSIDFDPRNPKDERIKIWKHQLLILNPNPKYKSDDTPKNYRDWLDLFNKSIDNDINIVLNVKNTGIAKTIQLIEYETLDPKTIAEMKISEAKKAMISIIENEGKIEGITEEKINSAKNAIKAGCTNELINAITGLTNEQIDELRKQH